ncbi:MAG: hypothetical protein ACP5PT_09090 [Brevinematia bacterium]
MNKTVLSFIVSLFLLSSLFPLVLSNPSTKGQRVIFLGLSINVEALEEAKLGESCNVVISIFPLYEESIYIKSITVEFDNPHYKEIYKETIISNTELSSTFVKTFTLKPESLGSIYCFIRCSYVVDKGTPYEKEYYGSFDIVTTRIGEKTYEDLENENYWLNSEKNLFTLTTLAFFITTFYLIWERYKEKSQEKLYKNKKKLI